LAELTAPQPTEEPAPESSEKPSWVVRVLRSPRRWWLAWLALPFAEKLRILIAIVGLFVSTNVGLYFGFWRDGSARPEKSFIRVAALRSTSGWNPYSEAKGSRVALDPLPSGQGFALDFSLVASGFVGITKEITPGRLSGTRSITFGYRGTGAQNTIEFKLLYPAENGKEAIFGGIWRHASNTRGKVRTVEIAYSEFACWPATGCRSGEPVVPGRVTKIDFAVSNKPEADDVAGRGSVSFENLLAVREG
jgi:hypothetical protein